MKRSLLVLVVLGSVRLASAETAVELDVAIERAAAERKPLILEIGAEWCKPCKEFEKHVLPDARVQAALKSVVFVQYDADEPNGSAVVKRLKITAYPTFIVLGVKGAEHSRSSGSADGEDGVLGFLEIVGNAENALDDELTMHAKLKANPGDIKTQLAAARWYVGRRLPREALWHYDAVAANPKATKEQRHTALDRALHLKRSLQWRAQLIDDAVALVRSEPGLAEYDDLIIATVSSTLPPAEAKALVGTVLAAQTDEAALNSLVYVALAAGANDHALTAAKKVVAKDRRAQFLDTLAEVHHVRGEREEALKVEDEAIALAPKLKELATNRERFASSRRDAPEVLTARARADALRARFDRVDALDRVAAPASQTEATARQKRSAEGARVQQALIKIVSEKCKTAAGTSTVAFAQVLAENEKIISVTPYTDAFASPALRACVSRELLGQALPDLGVPLRERTLTVKFAR